MNNQAPPGTTRLYLPGGGSFDLPLPGGENKLAVRGVAQAPAPSIVAPLLIGIALGAVAGGIVTWLVVKGR